MRIFKLITMLGLAFRLVYGIKKAPGIDTKGYKSGYEEVIYSLCS